VMTAYAPEHPADYSPLLEYISITFAGRQGVENESWGGK